MRLRTDPDGLQHAFHGWLRGHLKDTRVPFPKPTPSADYLSHHRPHRATIHREINNVRNEPSVEQACPGRLSRNSRQNGWFPHQEKTAGQNLLAIIAD